MILAILGLIGYGLYLLNYYHWYGLIPLALVILLRNRSIPLGKRVDLNVATGIIVPLSMIYPLMKIGLTIDNGFKTYLLFTVVLVTIFSRIESNSVVTSMVPAIVLGNVAVYCHVSPAVALPTLYLTILIVCDAIMLLRVLRRTHENVAFEIGGAKLGDGLIVLPGLLFLVIFWIVLQCCLSPIVPKHYLFVKEGKYR